MPQNIGDQAGSGAYFENLASECDAGQSQDVRQPLCRYGRTRKGVSFRRQVGIERPVSVEFGVYLDRRLVLVRTFHFISPGA